MHYDIINNPYNQTPILAIYLVAGYKPESTICSLGDYSTGKNRRTID